MDHGVLTTLLRHHHLVELFIIHLAIVVRVKICAPVQSVAVIVERRQDGNKERAGILTANQVTIRTGIQLLRIVGGDPRLHLTRQDIVQTIRLLVQIINDFGAAKVVHILARRTRTIGVFGEVNQQNQQMERSDGRIKAAAVVLDVMTCSC